MAKDKKKKKSNPLVKEVIKKGEGFSPTVYKDSAGLDTVGYGHKMKKGETLADFDTDADGKLSEAEAQALLDKDVEAHTKWRKNVKVPLTPEQEAALTSFEYNTGSVRSSIYDRINEGNFEAATKKMAEYHKVTDPKTGKKIPVQGLKNRRAAEKEQFDTPSFQAPWGAWETTTQEPDMSEPKKKKRGLMDRLGGAWDKAGSAVSKAGDKLGSMYDKAEDAWADSSFNEDTLKARIAERDKDKTEESTQLKAELKGQYEQDLIAKREADAAQKQAALAKVEADKKEADAEKNKIQGDAQAFGQQPGTADEGEAPQKDPLAELESKLTGLSLAGEDKQYWENQLAEIRARGDAAEQKIQSQELTESLIHAFTQMAAAMYGLKHGVNLSGLKFDKTDYKSRMDRAMARIDEQLSAAKDQRRAETQGRKEDYAMKRQSLLDQIRIKQQKKAEERAQAADNRAETGVKQRDRGLDIQQQAITGKQDETKKKAAAKLIADAEKKDAKLSEKMDSILKEPEKTGGGKENPKGTAQYKADAMGLLLGITLTPEDLERTSGSLWWKETKSWNEIKKGLIQKAGGAQPTAPTQPAANEVRRQTPDGTTAVFDAKTKQFLRYD